MTILYFAWLLFKICAPTLHPPHTNNEIFPGFPVIFIEWLYCLCNGVIDAKDSSPSLSYKLNKHEPHTYRHGYSLNICKYKWRRPRANSPLGELILCSWIGSFPPPSLSKIILEFFKRKSLWGSKVAEGAKLKKRENIWKWNLYNIKKFKYINQSISY